MSDEPARPDSEAAAASLESRVAALEEEVSKLRAALGSSRSTLAAPPKYRASAPAPRAAESAPEKLVSRVGIALLVLGCAFLFKYSIDNQWLGPLGRVALGAGIGSALLAAGIVLTPTRRGFSAVLLGGAIATFHVTLFAAYELYGFLALTPAVGLTLVVNALAAGLSIRREASLLAVIGALGAYGVPFVIAEGAASTAFITSYLAVVVVATGGIGNWKRWGGFALLSFFGTWLGIALLTSERIGETGTFGFGVALIAWAALVGPSAWRLDGPRTWSAIAMGLLQPVLTCALLVGGLEFGRGTVAGLMAALAVCAAATGRSTIRRTPERGVAGIGAAFLGTAICAAAVGLPESWVPAGLASVVFALALAAAPLSGGIVVLTRAAGVATVLLTGFHVAVGVELPDFAAVPLGVAIYVAAATVWQLRSSRPVVLTVLSHLTALGWAYGALEPVGAGASSLAWAALGLGELVLGVGGGRAELRVLGVATIIAVSIKLVGFDTSNVAQVWRVLLFMGIGAAFLAAGWLLPRLSAREPSASDGRPAVDR